MKYDHWKDDIAAELKAMEVNNTWSIGKLPKGKHFIGCRWIYKIKYNLDGSICRYEGHLVAKGTLNNS